MQRRFSLTPKRIPVLRHFKSLAGRFRERSTLLILRQTCLTYNSGEAGGRGRGFRRCACPSGAARSMQFCCREREFVLAFMLCLVNEMTEPNMREAREHKKPSKRSQLDPTQQSAGDGEGVRRVRIQVLCFDHSRHHVFQACHFLGYDPAGGFPSPPTAYRRGRRAQNLSRSRNSRAREGLTFTSSSTMAGFERRVEFPIADIRHSLGPFANRRCTWR